MLEGDGPRHFGGPGGSSAPPPPPSRASSLTQPLQWGVPPPPLGPGPYRDRRAGGIEGCGTPLSHPPPPPHGKGSREGKIGQGERGRTQGGKRLMGNAACGGKGSKGRDANGDRPMGRQLQMRTTHPWRHPPPPPPPPTPVVPAWQQQWVHTPQPAPLLRDSVSSRAHLRLTELPQIMADGVDTCGKSDTNQSPKTPPLLSRKL